jgi:hypothetical protein
MSALLEITEKLQDTQAAIVRLENVAADYPDSASINLSLGSLQKRERDLEAQLAEIIAAKHVDAMSQSPALKRGESELPTTLSALHETLYDFQLLAAQLFSVLKSETLKGSTHVTADKIDLANLANQQQLLIVPREELEQRLLRIHLEVADAAHRRRKDLLLLSGVLIVTSVTLCLCVWVIFTGGSGALDRTRAVALFTAIVTGLAGYVTGRLTK